MILAGGHLDAVRLSCGEDVFGLVVLVLALGLTGLWVWVLVRVRAHLVTCRSEVV